MGGLRRGQDSGQGTDSADFLGPRELECVTVEWTDPDLDKRIGSHERAIVMTLEHEETDSAEASSSILSSGR